MFNAEIWDFLQLIWMSTANPKQSHLVWISMHVGQLDMSWSLQEPFILAQVQNLEMSPDTGTVNCWGSIAHGFSDVFCIFFGSFLYWLYRNTLCISLSCKGLVNRDPFVHTWWTGEWICQSPKAKQSGFAQNPNPIDLGLCNIFPLFCRNALDRAQALGLDTDNLSVSPILKRRDRCISMCKDARILKARH